MGKILWLASFPKSGNTWLRAFLANYLADTGEAVPINRLPELSFGDGLASHYEQLSGKPVAQLRREDINRLRPRVHRLLASARDGLVFVKTHTVYGSIDGVPTITPDVTAGAIYVVRNPLDVAVSFAHHYGLSLETTVKAMAFADLRTPVQARHVDQALSDWSSHARGWLSARSLKVLCLRYEDMAADPLGTFSRALAFLGWPRDDARLARAAGRCEFAALAAQERDGGFVEASGKAVRFFRKGRVGAWREELPADLADCLIADHGEMMQALGYRDAAGAPVF